MRYDLSNINRQIKRIKLNRVHKYITEQNSMFLKGIQEKNAMIYTYNFKSPAFNKKREFNI